MVTTRLLRLVLSLFLFAFLYSAVQAQTPSDECSNAPLVNFVSYQGCGNIASTPVNFNGATASSTTPVPTCGGYNNGPRDDRWVRIVVPPNRTALSFHMNQPSGFLLNPFGAGVQPALAVYRGPDCSSLTQVGCYTAPTPGTGVNSEMRFQAVTGLVPGEVLWVRLWIAGNQKGTYTFAAADTLNLPETQCSTATPIRRFTCNILAGQDVVDAIDDNDCSSWGIMDNPVFFTFTVTSATPQPFNLTSTTLGCVRGNGMQLAIYRWNGNCSSVGGANTTNFRDCNTSSGSVTSLSTNLSPGNYMLIVDGYNSQGFGPQCGLEICATGIAPVADFTISACVNQPAQIQNLSMACGNSNPTWAWTFPGATPSSSTARQPTNIVWNTPGPRTVTLTLTDQYGTSTKSVTVNVLPSTTPSIANLPATACANGPAIVLTGAPSGGSFSGPGISGVYFNPAAAGPGTHTITYSGTNACGPYSTTQQVTVQPGPAVTLNAPTQACLGGAAITLTGTPAGGTFSGPGVSGNQFNPSSANLGFTNGTYQFTVRYSVNGPCGQASDTAVITVIGTTQPTITIPKTTFCQGDPVATLSGTPAGGTFTGPGVSGNQFNPATAGAGTHTITYNVNTLCGPLSRNITVTVTTGSPATVNLNPTYCVTDPAFNLTPNPRCGTFTGPGVTSGNCIFGNYITQPRFDPAAAGVGTHTITYSGSNICTAVFTVTVTAAGATPTITPIGGPYCTTDPTITLSATPTGGTFSGPGVSGTQFSPATAGVGTHNISYTAIVCGTPQTAQATVTVGSGGTVTLAALGGPYCTTAAPQTLNGSPSGGTYSGPGVVGNQFNPATAGPGTHTIRYEITGSSCGNGAATRTVTVQAPATVSIGNAPGGTVCVTSAALTLTGTPAGGTFSGPGITGSQFNPATAGVGSHPVTYSITDPVCGNRSATATIVVGNSTVASFSALPDTVCLTATPITLSANPAGGSFSGPGVSGNQFNPTTAGIGSHTLSYSGTDACGPYTVSETIEVVSISAPVFGVVNQNPCVSTPPIRLTATPAGGTFIGTGVVQTSPGVYVFDPSVSGAGTFNVRYELNERCGLAQAQLDFTVTAAPVASITGLPASICVSSAAVTLQTTPAGGTLSGPGISGNTFDPATAGLGTHTITYAGVDPNCGAYTASATVVVNSTSSASFINPPDTLCLTGSPATLVGTPAGGTYAGPGMTGATFDPLAAGLGPQVVTYSGADACGPYSTSANIIVVQGPDAAFSGIAPSYCLGAVDSLRPVPLTAGGTFRLNGQIVSVPVALPAAGGSYTLTHTQLNGGCNNVASFDFTVEEPVIALSPDASICPGGATTLTATISNQTGANVTWSPAAGLNATTGTQVIASPAQTTTYTAVLSTLAGCTDTATVTIMVDASLQAVAGFQLTPDSGEAPLTVRFSNTSTNANSYLWVVGTDTFRTANPADYMFDSEGTYTVTLVAEPNTPCADTATATVTVLNSVPVLFVPNVFSPNGDGTHDRFVITAQGLSTYTLTLFDRWGLQVFESNSLTNTWDGTRNGSACPEGVYVYVIKATAARDGRAIERTGSVTLLR